MLSARLVAQAGYRVSMHGHSPDPQIAANLELAGPGVRYDALDTLAPRAFSLLRLRDTLGLRSCINTVLRMWNPSRAPASVQGVFHPSYRGLQARAAELLDQRDLMVIKGGGGEFERHPGKEIALFGLRNGAHMQATAPALISEAVRLQDGGADVDLAELWYGQRGHAFAEAVIVGTAALALWTVKAAPSLEAAEALARSLWEARHHAEGLLA
ncbi:hypothetical protein ACS3SW_07955 [Roseobacteraceae bacterium S113]